VLCAGLCGSRKRNLAIPSQGNPIFIREQGSIRMRIPRSVGCAFGIVAAATLAGCAAGGSSSSALAPTSTNPALTYPTAALLPVTFGEAMRTHRATWFSPDASRAPRLLYVGDLYFNLVNVFTMPGLVLKGQITNGSFSAVEGLCNDTQGNIWVVSDGNQTIFKYSRTGTELGSVADSYGYPGSCAVDPTTGNLAVGNFFNSSFGPGQVVVYAAGSGSGTTYSYASQGAYYYVGYDATGDLYTDGCAAYRCTSGETLLSELPKGSSTMHGISITGGTVEYPGNVIWSKTNRYLNVFDQLCGGINAGCAYWVTISGSAGTITGVTKFSNSSGGNTCDLVAATVPGNGEKFAAGVDYNPKISGALLCSGGGYLTSSVYRWANPAGGIPTNSYSNTLDVYEPFGATVSTK
jgi:hypothetical protein